MSTAPVVNLPDQCAASVVMSLEHIVASTVSPFTFNEQTFKWPGSRWKMDIVFPPVKDPIVAGQLKAFFLRLQGIHGRFLMGDPSKRTPIGTALGSPVVSGAGQEGNILITNGWLPDQPDLLKAGDYIQVGNGDVSRYHMIVEDAVSSATGMASLRIEPAMRSAPAAGSVIITDNPRGLFRLNSNEPSWSVTPGSIHRFSFSAQEVISA